MKIHAKCTHIVNFWKVCVNNMSRLHRHVWVAYEPTMWNEQCHPKLKKIMNTFEEHMFLHEISEKA